MLHVVFSRVKVDQVDRLRSWMAELMARPQEVRQTFEQEGVRHEMAFLVEAREGPLLVYAIEVEGDDLFRAGPTKGVYVSYDTSTSAKHSLVGLPGMATSEPKHGGDWMIEVLLAE